jgi:hypothetical protein
MFWRVCGASTGELFLVVAPRSLAGSVVEASPWAHRVTFRDGRWDGTAVRIPPVSVGCFVWSVSWCCMM